VAVVAAGAVAVVAAGAVAMAAVAGPIPKRIDPFFGGGIAPGFQADAFLSARCIRDSAEKPFLGAAAFLPWTSFRN
jgi:hypothetical protein